MHIFETLSSNLTAHHRSQSLNQERFIILAFLKISSPQLHSAPVRALSRPDLLSRPVCTPSPKPASSLGLWELLPVAVLGSHLISAQRDVSVSQRRADPALGLAAAPPSSFLALPAHLPCLPPPTPCTCQHCWIGFWEMLLVQR